MPNANYAVSGYTAFAVEQVLKRAWIPQVTKAIPLLACIKDSDLNWNKGFKVQGTKLLIPVLSALVSGLNTGNLGVADASEIPAAWPTYDATAGFTQAQFEFTHLERPMTIRSSEKVIGGGRDGARGNLIDGKVMQLMATFKSIMADMIHGTAADSRTALMGIGYAISASNVVGNIDQSTDTYWRGGLQTGVGTLSLPIIDNAFDTINQNADESGNTDAPDLLLLSYNGTGVNTFGKARSQIAPQERFENKEFKAKFGIANFEYLGMKAVQDNRSATGTANILTTKTWFYGGYDKPEQLQTQRIPGSSADEMMFVQWCCLACNEIRRNFRLTGING